MPAKPPAKAMKTAVPKATIEPATDLIPSKAKPEPGKKPSAQKAARPAEPVKTKSDTVKKTAKKKSTMSTSSKTVHTSEKFISDFDLHLLQEGRHIRAYEKMGAHLVRHNGVDGVHFAVWAPNAERVSVVGDFNQWDGDANPLQAIQSSGIWAGFVPEIGKGTLYKYEIRTHQGHLLPLKSDPYAFFAEKPPQTASIVWPMPKSTDMPRSLQSRHAPISIYEVHLGSWRRKEDNQTLSYRELAEQLIPYAQWMGFTHLELMPVNEHPFSGSWGYQPTGLHAPTSRFGNPDEFCEFVSLAHDAGLKVILDWVPGHFPSDAHGLADFDGTHLYEHADPREGFHKDWNTLIYNYGRTEVANFLIANGLFWLDRYGIDALRVDAVASMLYRDYSRKEGEWIPNQHGGRENLEAIAFLRRTNQELFANFTHATTMAEESTAFPGVSRPLYDGGLGFGFKWNMGWMHDTLRYMQQDPIHRQYHHNDLTFGLLYAYSENFVLPLSHDEVVHGKGSLLTKMPGDEWQKFANLRAYFGFMWAHPGKKLLFMGGEFGQASEWNHDQSLDWHLTDLPRHRGVQLLVRDLNLLYREIPALHVHDCEPEGFEWLESDAADTSVLTFLRRGNDEKEIAVVVCNFTPVPRENYRVGVPLPGFYEERFNSDSAHYGGSDMGNQGGAHSEPHNHHSRPHSLSITLPPLSTSIFVYRG